MATPTSSQNIYTHAHSSRKQKLYLLTSLINDKRTEFVSQSQPKYSARRLTKNRKRNAEKNTKHTCIRAYNVQAFQYVIKCNWRIQLD